MSSKMEQIIDDIQEYLNNCKFSPLSSTKILVNKEELEELIEELRTKTPEEIKRYQKMIANKDEILASAQRQGEAIVTNAQYEAERILSEAQMQKTELVSEQQILQQAYEQANEVVAIATKEAQSIIDQATADANGIRTGAMVYTDSQLKNIQDILINSIDTTKARSENLINSLQGYLDVVNANRAELNPQPQPAVVGESAESDFPLPEITLDESDLN